MIKLINNMGIKWLRNGNLIIKTYNNTSSFQSLNRIPIDFNDFVKEINKINGNFSFVFENDKYIIAAVDRIRSIPLFYTLVEGEFYISDDARWLQKRITDRPMNEISRVEFFLTGYVTGEKTLYSSLNQIQAGEYIVFEKKTAKINKAKYFNLKHGNYFLDNQEHLIEQLDEVYTQVFKNLISSLNGRTAVLPLSGGLDSRLIAVMLKKLQYKDVICFSYGKEKNKESLISKTVADMLGYEWKFIPYTNEKWSKWYNSNSKIEYFRYADGLSSIPHIQDIIAVKELKEKGAIPTDSVFIPGHAGDFVAGSHIPERFVTSKQISSEKLVNQILKNHYNLWDDKGLIEEYREEFVKKIFEIIEYKEVYSSEEATDAYEQWDWSERQSKFIAHSVRVYDFYDYEWRLPLWEKKIIDFWGRVTQQNRLNRKLYFDYVLSKQSEFSNLNRFEYNKGIKLFKEIIKKIPLLLNYINSYRRIRSLNNHPLEWYGIMSNSDFNKGKLKRMQNINSFLTYDYLHSTLSD